MNRATRRAGTRSKKRLPSGMAPESTLLEAIRQHSAGNLREAEGVYHKILAVTPQNADALHFLGVLRHQQGHTEEGIKLVQHALALVPGYVDAWSNLGNLYKESAQLDDAEAAYRHALALDEKHAAAWNNLGVVLRLRGQLTAAEEALRRAIDVSTTYADAHFNLGNVLHQCRRLAEAITAYRQVLLLSPGHTHAHLRLGNVLYVSGAHEEAADVFRRWLVVEPENPIPAHMFAACSGENIPDRASDDYVRATFDGFAASFDDVLLHRLNYDAPQQLLKALTPVLGTPQREYDVLDAGCGTGLCGPLLKPYAKALSGVDLSPGMLCRARARGAYDRLHEEEITRFLATHVAAFDVIASADTLCYFGELQPLAQAAFSALRSGGWICFTVERSDAVDTYRIQPHGRYSHARTYLEGVLGQAGFEAIHVVPAVLRRELGSDVQGWVVRARVPNNACDTAQTLSQHPRPAS
jgi:predicted TPR repeat methyltransferase